jgi:hypothetical protein
MLPLFTWGLTWKTAGNHTLFGFFGEGKTAAFAHVQVRKIPKAATPLTEALAFVFLANEAK